MHIVGAEESLLRNLAFCANRKNDCDESGPFGAYHWSVDGER